MQGTYHFECLNPACDWGVDVDAGSLKEAFNKAFKLHDEYCKSVTCSDPSGSRYCPAEHYTIKSPDGKLSEY